MNENAIFWINSWTSYIALKSGTIHERSNPFLGQMGEQICPINDMIYDYLQWKLKDEFSVDVVGGEGFDLKVNIDQLNCSFNNKYHVKLLVSFIV